MSFCFTNCHDVVTPAKRSVKYTFDCSYNRQCRHLTLGVSTGSPPALEYADSLERIQYFCITLEIMNTVPRAKHGSLLVLHMIIGAMVIGNIHMAAIFNSLLSRALTQMSGAITHDESSVS